MVKAPIRVVIADDHALFREGTRRILDRQPDIAVIAEAADGLRAVEAILLYKPDVALLDIRMDGLNGIEVARQIHAQGVGTASLILSAHDDDDYVRALLEAGASGYLLKTIRANDLVDAVRRAHMGEIVLDPAIASKIVRLVVDGPHTRAHKVSLTAKEMVVLRLVCRGLRNKEIAQELALSVRTVEWHLDAILDKLGFRSRTEAALYAASQGWFLQNGGGAMKIGAENAPATRAFSARGIQTAAGWLRGLVWIRPPLHDPRFWATQALVVGIAGAHDALEAFDLLPHFGMAYFLPMSMFFIPVVYSALYFGLSGALTTALWCTVISTPNWVLWHHGSARYGVMSQMLIVDAVAVFVGSRVDQQMKARADAEAASRALETSETKYRGLFETAGEGVLVLDEGERIVECNAAASMLFRRPREELCNALLKEIMPGDVASALRSASLGVNGPPEEIRLERPDGTEVWVEPVCTPFAEREGITQIVLRDVTEQKRRQAGLETYAAQILKAQEDERKRIAQEMHDETLQSLVVLCRKLDESDADTPASFDSLLLVLREAHDHAESLVESVRGFARGLRPPILDDLGLTPAIERLVGELSARSTIDSRLTVRGCDRRLPADVELALFRISQEALHNVERHSGASNVRVNLHYQPQSIEVVIIDNGAGFSLPVPLDGLANESKLGLIGMQERARTVGGKLRIRSTPRTGTRVAVRIPAPPTSEPSTD
jgi:PAS domain S-box-containing protein